MVDCLVERVNLELGAKAMVIATGGHAEVIAPLSRTISAVEPWLTLEGLRIIYDRNCGGDRN